MTSEEPRKGTPSRRNRSLKDVDGDKDLRKENSMLNECTYNPELEKTMDNTEDDPDCDWDHVLKEEKDYYWLTASYGLKGEGHWQEIIDSFELKPIDNRYIRHRTSGTIVALCKDGVYAFSPDFAYACLLARKKKRALRYLQCIEWKREGPVRRCAKPYDPLGHDLFTYGDSTSEEEEEEEEEESSAEKELDTSSVVRQENEESSSSSSSEESDGFGPEYDSGGERDL